MIGLLRSADSYAISMSTLPCFVCCRFIVEQSVRAGRTYTAPFNIDQTLLVGLTQPFKLSNVDLTVGKHTAKRC